MFINADERTYWACSPVSTLRKVATCKEDHERHHGQRIEESMRRYEFAQRMVLGKEQSLPRRKFHRYQHARDSNGKPTCISAPMLHYTKMKIKTPPARV